MLASLCLASAGMDPTKTVVSPNAHGVHRAKRFSDWLTWPINDVEFETTLFTCTESTGAQRERGQEREVLVCRDMAQTRSG